MPDEKTPRKSPDLGELESLPELEELEPFHDLEPLEPDSLDLGGGELDPLAAEDDPFADEASLEEVPPVAAGAADDPQVDVQAAGAGPKGGGGGALVKRKRKQQSAEEIEAAARASEEALAALHAEHSKLDAPTLLKKAAVIVAAGCLLPWLAVEGNYLIQIGAKALVLAGAYLFHLCVKARAGEKIDKTFQGLFDKAFVDVSKRPKNFAVALLHKVPTPLHVLGWVVLIGGLVASWFIGPNTAGLAIENPGVIGLAGVSMLAWAAATFVHIDSYERGGHFNPLFPLMFAGHAIAGVMTLLRNFTAEDKGIENLISMVGAAVVAGGGFFAMYTIVVSMKQAKAMGDLKKKAKSEQRQAARKARQG